MPESYRDIVAYGDFILLGMAEGVLLRVGKDGKVQGVYLAVTDIPELPLSKISELSGILGKKVEEVNGKTGVKISLSPSDIGAIASANNLTDLADVVKARASLGLGSAAIVSAKSFEPFGIVNDHAIGAGNGFHIPPNGITNSEIASNAAIADSKINVSIPTRTPVTYAMNWATHSGSDAVSYRKFANKMVYLSGAATKNIALLASDLIFTLPTGFRPDKLVRLMIYGASGTGTLVTAFLTINTSGEVRVQPGATSPSQYVAFPDNCAFIAA